MSHAAWKGACLATFDRIVFTPITSFHPSICLFLRVKYTCTDPEPPCHLDYAPCIAPQVFAWDTSSNGPDKDEDDGRSFISAISEVITDSSETCNGKAKKTMGEARMDIEDSEMAYLGYHGSESYGLTWKVRRRTTSSCSIMATTPYCSICLKRVGVCKRRVCALQTKSSNAWVLLL